MKMETETDKNRVGIYTQVSAETTAVGEGLAPQGDKSPVVNTICNEKPNEKEIQMTTEKETKNEVANETVHEIKQENEKETENDTNNEKEIATTHENETAKEPKNEKGEEPSKISTTAHAEPQKDNKFLDKDDHPAGGDNEISQFSHSDDDGHSNYSARDGSLNLGDDYRGRERDKMNRATVLEVFPRAKEHYGRKRWNKTVATLQRIGFVNWEINTMLGALDKMAKKLNQTHGKRPSESTSTQPAKFLRLDDKQPTLANSNIRLDTSGILAQNSKFIPKIIQTIVVPENDTVIDPKLDQPRMYIGDASHNKYHILQEYRNILTDALQHFLRREALQSKVPLGIVRHIYINQILLVQCENQQTAQLLKTRMSELDGLWPDAKFVPRVRRGRLRRKIQISIPYSGLETEEILEIIGNQNKLDTKAWTVTERVDVDNGIILDVVVDRRAQLHLLHDQDDLYFLLTRAPIKLFPLAMDGSDQKETEVSTDVSTDVTMS